MVKQKQQNEYNMYLPNMTDKEFLDEFNSEHKVLRKRIHSYWNREGRRKTLKAGTFPHVQTFETTTDKGNTYIITIHVVNKNRFKHSRLYINCSVIIDRRVEPLILFFNNGDKGMLVERIYGHFFRRYRERMNLSGTTKDLVKRYAKFNALAQYTYLESDEKGQHFYQTSDEGVSMGVVTPDGHYLIKTFLPIEDMSTIQFFRQAEALKQLQKQKEKYYGNKIGMIINVA